MVSALDKEVAHNIRDLFTKLKRKFRKQISNPEQMSITEFNVLNLLMTSNLLPSELCAQLTISSQYMSQVLNHLGDLGFVSRKISKEDKRKSFVCITKKGKTKVEKSRLEREEWLAGLIAVHYTEEDKQIIDKAVALLLTLPDL